MFFNSDFWPLFWGILGAGFAVTAMVSLLVASIRLPRVHRRPPLTTAEAAPRHHEEAEERVLVGGRK
jgi:hypothetical protein